MPIIYNYQPDEITAPPLSLTIDDDSLCWWAGTQQCFSSVALRAILDASKFTSALAGYVHQHNEDIVPASAPLTGTDDHWQSNVIPQAAALFQKFPYLPDADSIPSAAVFHPPDDGVGSCGPSLNGLFCSVGPIAPTMRGLQPFAFEAQDLAATPSGPIDEDYWVPSRGIAAAGYQCLPISQDQPDFVSFVPAFQLDEDYGPIMFVAVRPISSPPVQQLWSDSDFISPAFQPDEDYWVPALAVQTTRCLVLPIASEQAEFVFAQPSFVVDEGAWPIFPAVQNPTANLQPLNAWLGTENSQLGISFLALPHVAGVQWLRRDGHAKGLFSRRR